MTSPSHLHTQARVQPRNTYNHTYIMFLAGQNNLTLNPDKTICTLFAPDCSYYEQSGPKNKQHCTTHGNAYHGNSFPWQCIPMAMHTHGNAYPWQCIPMAMHTHGNAYPWQCIPMAMHTHGNAYPWQCIPMAMHTHGNAYPWQCIPMAKHPKVLGLTLDPKLTYSTHIHNNHK